MGLISGITEPIAAWQDRKSRAKAAGLLDASMQKGYAESGIQNQQTYDDISAIFKDAIATGNTARLQMAQQSAPDAFNQYLASNGFDLSKSWDQQAGVFGNTGLTGNAQQDTQAFLDPSMQFRMEQGVRGMDSSAASKGNLFAGGYGKEIQNYSQGLASTEYGNAFNRQEQVKKDAYQNWADRLNALQNTRKQQMGQLSELMQGGNQANAGLSSARENMGNNQMDITMGRAQSTGQNNAAQSMSRWNTGDTMRMIGGGGDAALSFGSMAMGAPPSGFGTDASSMASGGASQNAGSSYQAMGLTPYTPQSGLNNQAMGGQFAQAPAYKSGFGSTGWA
jgi:hypothetical protein